MDQEMYRTERESLIKAELEQSRMYDRTIVTLIAGALGLSLTFIRQVVPNYDRGTVTWLEAGWALLILSLLSTLTSFLSSQSALRRQRAIVDGMFSGKSAGSENGAAQATHWLNIASLILFVAGVVCLAFFVTANIVKG